MLKKYSTAIIILLITVIVGLIIGHGLPAEARIPTHWNVKGEIDNWVSKPLGLILLPGISFLLLLFFIFFPWFSPRYNQKAKQFDKLLPALATIMTLMFSAIYLLSLLVAGKSEFDGTELMWVLLGILFILLGNLFPKMPSSFFIGIRTPWTLSSEEVWRKTHRAGGKAFMAGGVFFVLAGVIKKYLGLQSVFFFIIIGVMIVFPIVYSWWLYQREKQRN